DPAGLGRVAGGDGRREGPRVVPPLLRPLRGDALGGDRPAVLPRHRRRAVPARFVHVVPGVRPRARARHRLARPVVGHPRLVERLPGGASAVRPRHGRRHGRRPRSRQPPEDPGRDHRHDLRRLRRGARPARDDGDPRGVPADGRGGPAHRVAHGAALRAAAGDGPHRHPRRADLHHRRRRAARRAAHRRDAAVRLLRRVVPARQLHPARPAVTHLPRQQRPPPTRSRRRGSGGSAMTKQVRTLGIALMVLFGILFVQLNYLQVVHADKLAHDPRNTRRITRDFTRDRGDIQTSDGVVLARSVKSDDAFKRQRQYPAGALFGHITGYFGYYNATGVEQTYNDQLSGRHLGTRLPTGANLFSNAQLTGTVTLSLSNKLQQVAAAALGNRKGTVVALDPTTGAILALWSFPSYDPNPLASHDLAAAQSAFNALDKDPNQPMLAKGWRRAFAPG